MWGLEKSRIVIGLFSVDLSAYQVSVICAVNYKTAKIALSMYLRLYWVECMSSIISLANFNVSGTNTGIFKR